MVAAHRVVVDRQRAVGAAADHRVALRLGHRNGLSRPADDLAVAIGYTQPFMLLAAVLGFAFAWLGSIPIAGPIAALVVTRGLAGRIRSAALVALGGALVEAVYACLAFWGFSTFLKDYPLVEPISRGVAAAILAFLGVTFIRGLGEGKPPPPDEDGASQWQSFLLGASICALNPTLVATWTAVVTMLHGGGLVDLQGRQALPFGAGVLAGIVGWFSTLLAIIRRYRERFSRAALGRVVRVIGALLLVLSGWFAVRFVRYFIEPSRAAGQAML